jgi:hypothetical protein
VHVPQHRVLWWAWGNAESERTFTETTFAFSRKDTELARALREALGTRGVSEEPTVRVAAPPRSERVSEGVLVFRPVRRPRLSRYRHKVSFAYENLARGHLVWRWRLFALSLWFVNPWLAPLGIAAFEALVVVLMRWHPRRDVRG